MEIPGFYFDPVKKKYFKVVKPSSSVSGSNSQYSRDTITQKINDLEIESSIDKVLLYNASQVDRTVHRMMSPVYRINPKAMCDLLNIRLRSSTQKKRVKSFDLRPFTLEKCVKSSRHTFIIDSKQHIFEVEDELGNIVNNERASDESYKYRRFTVDDRNLYKHSMDIMGTGGSISIYDIYMFREQKKFEFSLEDFVWDFDHYGEWLYCAMSEGRIARSNVNRISGTKREVRTTSRKKYKSDVLSVCFLQSETALYGSRDGSFHVSDFRCRDMVKHRMPGSVLNMEKISPNQVVVSCVKDDLRLLDTRKLDSSVVTYKTNKKSVDCMQESVRYFEQFGVLGVHSGGLLELFQVEESTPVQRLNLGVFKDWYLEHGRGNDVSLVVLGEKELTVHGF